MRAWFNGRELRTPEEPALSVLDHGLIVGDGVFETVQILNGEPFALTRHLNRLTRSARGLGLDDPDLDLVREGVQATVDPSVRFGRIRITVTSGRGPLGSARGRTGQSIVVIAEACPRPASTTSIVTVPWIRDERGPLAGLKTTSYAGNALMLTYAAERGASEAVMANSRGHLCEGTGTNVFYVEDRQIVTPTLESGCLAGITRGLVLEWCQGALPVVERDTDIGVLRRAEEIFLVSSIRDVQGVHRLDDQEFPAPGPMTTAVAKIFAEMSATTIDP